MISLVLFGLLLAPFVNAQVGENCLPTLSQTLQEQTTSESSTIYHFVLNFTNTGFNKDFTESTPINTANLPLISVTFGLFYNPDNTTIVSTYGLTTYSTNSHGTTFELNLNGSEVAPLDSFLGAGYSVRGDIPNPELDVWNCDYSSFVSSSSTTTSFEGTTTHLGFPSTCNELVCGSCQVCIDDGGEARCISPDDPNCTPTTTAFTNPSSSTTSSHPTPLPSTSTTSSFSSPTTTSATSSFSSPSTTSNSPSSTTTDSVTNTPPIPTTSSNTPPLVPESTPQTTSTVSEPNFGVKTVASVAFTLFGLLVALAF